MHGPTDPVSLPSPAAPRRPARAATVVCCLGVLLSGAAGVWQSRHNAVVAADRFDAASQRTAEQIVARMHSVERGLRGARGAVIAAGTDRIDRRRFRAYGDSREIAVEFPGAHGFGIVRRVAESEQARFVADARRDGAPDFAVRQLQPHAGDRYVIQYIEPVESNAAALGLDIASERSRREAAQASMRTGLATLTAPITLVQATGQPLRSFLVLLPIYAADRPADTPEASAAATFGWAYAPLVIEEVLHDMGFGDAGLSLTLKDVSGTDERVFFSSPPSRSERVEGLAGSRVVQVFGRSWRVDAQAHRSFVDALGQRSPTHVVVIGVTLTGLLGLALFLYGQTLTRAVQVTNERARREVIAEEAAAARAAEQRLRASESVLDRTGAIAGVGGWGLDLRTRKLTWTAQTYRIHDVEAGFEPDLETAMNFYPAEARTAIERAVAAAIETGAEWDLELPFVTAKGRSLWVRAAGAAEREGGQCVRLSGAFQDITERKRAQAQLTQTNERFAMASDSAGIGIWEFDVAANRLIWDVWMYRLYGVPASSGSEPYDLWVRSLHPEDRDRCEREIADALRGDKEFDTEFRIVRPDGRVCHLKGSARTIRDTRGVAVAMTGVNFDVTQRRQAEAEARRSSELLRGAIDAIDEAFVIFDPDDRVLYCNDKCRELYPTSANLIVPGKTFEEILRAGAALGQYPAAKGRTEAWVAERLAIRQRGSATLVTHLDDGRVLRVIDRRMPDGHTVGFRVDITEQVRATEAAQAASHAKSQFLANMSHEIRSPMNAVVGLTYLLRRTHLSAEQTLFVDNLATASKSLLAVINDVLDLSKIEAGEVLLERTAFSPATLIREQADLIGVGAQAKGIAFEVEIADELPVALEGDAAHLGQVLTNLLTNAVKFTDKGSVVLHVSQPAARAGRVTLCFAVRDTGIGIAPELQARLFQPFVQADASITRRFGGTGLGLSIVKHLVELMGGRLELTSAAGAGSEFSVTLEFATAAADALAEAAAVEAVPDAHALTGFRVLVVDDSEINVDVARRILELQGAHVGTASGGFEAVHQLQNASQAYDVVLMDLQMPVLDGVEATRLIRRDAALAELPIIALTAGALGSERQRAMAAGMNDFVVKPFAAQALTLCIRRHARAGPARPPAPHGPAGAGTGPDLLPTAWPSLPGIDIADVHERLGGDLNLFNTLLGRLLDEFGNVSVPSGDSPSLERHARAMHKLCGSAGMLGARAVHRLAVAMEASCELCDTDELQRLGPELTGALAALGESHRALQAVRAATQRPEASTLATDMDHARLSDLIALLRQQNLSALDRFHDLAAPLRQRMGEGPYVLARDHVDGLRFNEAAQVLEAWQRQPDPII